MRSLLTGIFTLVETVNYCNAFNKTCKHV